MGEEKFTPEEAIEENEKTSMNIDKARGIFNSIRWNEVRPDSRGSGSTDGSHTAHFNDYQITKGESGTLYITFDSAGSQGFGWDTEVSENGKIGEWSQVGGIQEYDLTPPS